MSSPVPPPALHDPMQMQDPSSYRLEDVLPPAWVHDYHRWIGNNNPIAEREHLFCFLSLNSREFARLTARWLDKGTRANDEQVRRSLGKLAITEDQKRRTLAHLRISSAYPLVEKEAPVAYRPYDDVDWEGEDFLGFTVTPSNYRQMIGHLAFLKVEEVKKHKQKVIYFCENPFPDDAAKWEELVTKCALLGIHACYRYFRPHPQQASSPVKMLGRKREPVTDLPEPPKKKSLSIDISMDSDEESSSDESSDDESVDEEQLRQEPILIKREKNTCNSLYICRLVEGGEVGNDVYRYRCVRSTQSCVENIISRANSAYGCKMFAVAKFHNLPDSPRTIWKNFCEKEIELICDGDLKRGLFNLNVSLSKFMRSLIEFINKQ